MTRYFAIAVHNWPLGRRLAALYAMCAGTRLMPCTKLL